MTTAGTKQAKEAKVKETKVTKVATAAKTAKPRVKTAHDVEADLPEAPGEAVATPITAPSLWASRPSADIANEFQIFDGDQPVGPTLSPGDSATVLRWLMGRG